jgi:hypothetical protein
MPDAQCLPSSRIYDAGFGDLIASLEAQNSTLGAAAEEEGLVLFVPAVKAFPHQRTLHAQDNAFSTPFSGAAAIRQVRNACQVRASTVPLSGSYCKPWHANTEQLWAPLPEEDAFDIILPRSRSFPSRARAARTVLFWTIVYYVTHT